MSTDFKDFLKDFYALLIAIYLLVFGLILFLSSLSFVYVLGLSFFFGPIILMVVYFIYWFFSMM